MKAFRTRLMTKDRSSSPRRPQQSYRWIEQSQNTATSPLPERHTPLRRPIAFYTTLLASSKMRTRNHKPLSHSLPLRPIPNRMWAIRLITRLGRRRRQPAFLRVVVMVPEPPSASRNNHQNTTAHASTSPHARTPAPANPPQPTPAKTGALTSQSPSPWHSTPRPAAAARTAPARGSAATC